MVTKAIVDNGGYEYSFDPESASQTLLLKEAGQFITATLVATAISMPLVLHHSRILNTKAVVMTLVGGFLIYFSVWTFYRTFEQLEESDDLDGGVI